MKYTRKMGFSDFGEGERSYAFNPTRFGVEITDGETRIVLTRFDLHPLQRAITQFQEMDGSLVKIVKIREYFRKHNLPGELYTTLGDVAFEVYPPKGDDGVRGLVDVLVPLFIEAGITFQVFYDVEYPRLKVHLDQFMAYMEQETDEGASQ